ncbi:hypothetical protein [Candidatus Uabimicrobium sp. HlEnr_7]|uniref:hypothetical protein n=1 Tax=Candidatus Uabimicrobium helgolandensis TaxID=3095367 RepID=UPI003556A228
MRLLIVFLLIVSIFANEEKFTLEVSSQIHESKSVSFIAHSGTGAFDSYLILNLPYKHVKKVYDDLQVKLEKTLKNRGEAHITVITPPEYYNQLRNYISIEEINEIAKDMKIQNARFDIICIGRGEKKIDGKKEHTYYIVVESLDLRNIRKKIWDLYVERGGDPQKFNAERYYPHITLGFTRRDLHESDGIIKDRKSLFAFLVEAKQEK